MRRRKPGTIKLSQADQCELKRLLGDGRAEQRVARTLPLIDNDVGNP